MRSYLRSELLYALERHLESAPLDDMLKAIIDLGLTIRLFSDEQSLLQVQVTPEDTKQQNECCAGCACDAVPETPNPFIVQHEQKRDEMAKLGLDDLQDWEQSKIIREAKKYIKEHGIDKKEGDVEEYKIIVHHIMRDHYLAYKKYLESEK